MEVRVSYTKLLLVALNLIVAQAMSLPSFCKHTLPTKQRPHIRTPSISPHIS